MSRKLNTKEFDKQKMVEWRKKVGVGPIMYATIIDEANSKIDKLRKENLEEEEAFNVRVDAERKLTVIDANAVLAMQHSNLEYDRNLAKKKANYIFVDLIKLQTATFRPQVDVNPDGMRTLYSNYKAIKNIQKEQEEEIIPKMKELFKCLFHLGLTTVCDINEVGLTMADIRRIVEAKKFTGLTITKDKSEEERKAIYEASDTKECIDKLNVSHNMSGYDDIMIDGLFSTNKVRLQDSRRIAEYLIEKGLITLEDLQSGVEGLASQFIMIWNTYDLANTVDLSHNILKAEIEKLDLKTETFNMDGVYTNIQSTKDGDKVLALLDTAQKYIVNDLRKETLTPILRRYKKFNRNVSLERDGFDLVSPIADTFNGYLDTYIKIAIPSIKELHDRIVCNYGDKVQLEEKFVNAEGVEETRMVDKIKLNTKMCIASIITLLFIDRLLHIPEFLRGIEVIFTSFLELTSETWEVFARKLDEVINAIDFNIDEEIVAEYEKLAEIKIKNYAHEEETVENTHGEKVPVVSEETHNVEEELDKGNAVRITDSTILVPQNKNEEQC